MTNLELAEFINEGLKTDYDIYIDSEETPDSLWIENFVIEPAVHFEETRTGTETFRGFAVSVSNDGVESLIKTFRNIHGALQYVFTALEVRKVRIQVQSMINKIYSR